MEVEKIKSCLDSVESYLAHKETEYTQLYEKYQGVRPSWVSAELAIINAEIVDLKKQVADLKERIPRDVD